MPSWILIFLNERVVSIIKCELVTEHFKYMTIMKLNRQLFDF